MNWNGLLLPLYQAAERILLNFQLWHCKIMQNIEPTFTWNCKPKSIGIVRSDLAGKNFWKNQLGALIRLLKERLQPHVSRMRRNSSIFARMPQKHRLQGRNCLCVKKRTCCSCSINVFERPPLKIWRRNILSSMAPEPIRRYTTTCQQFLNWKRQQVFHGFSKSPCNAWVTL